MANKGKKRQLTSDMSTGLNKTVKRNKGHNTTCPICEENFKPGCDSIFCEGDCQKYIHRRCASLTKEQFKKGGESDLPFYCLHCITSRQSSEIDELKKVVSDLSAKINSSEVQSSPVSNGHLGETEPTPVSKPTTTTTQQTTKERQLDDRKFNLVVFGIKECPNGTKRPDRVKHDIESSVSILSKLNDEIRANSVRDSFRLGKFKKDQTRPRPLLLKLNRAIDVITVLSNRSSVEDKSIIIKPDMTPDEKQVESLLLKERWSLMESGTNKSDIKIKSGSLFVKGKKHGYVRNSVYYSVNPVAATATATDSNSN